VSCKTTSKEELANTTPVSPPTVNKKIKPKAQRLEGVKGTHLPWKVPIHLKILIPVGIAIIIVAVVK
jgi:hypothetical protein